jgi:hypothetical protein
VKSKLQKPRVIATSTPLGNVQALTVLLGQGHVICVNLGLMLFSYRLARVMAPHMIQRTPTDPDPPAYDQSADFIAEAADWLSSPTRAPVGSGLDP